MNPFVPKRSSALASNPKRVFVIGIDGGTFGLIKPWIKQGKLKNIARLIDNGCHGELTTTIQPLTGPAWTSFMTGKNPGKHGIFDFIVRVPGSYDVRLVDSTIRDPESLWRVLSRHGKRVAVMNIPLNYPPEEVNGVLIPWMDAPGVDGNFAYPPGLGEEIKEHVGEYILSVDFSASLDKHARDLQSLTDNTAAVAEYIMDNHPWDFLITLFSATDLAQHAFWKFMDSHHPRHDPEGAVTFGNIIFEVYDRIDRHIGRFLDKLDGSATVVLVSDHGAGPLRKVVNLNRWLEECGWLSFRSATHGGLSGNPAFFSSRAVVGRAARSLAGFVKKNLPLTMRRKLKRLFPGLGSQMESFILASTIDWSRTRAFALGAYGNIFINLEGREPEGTVQPGDEYEKLREEIAERLLLLKDPDTGQPVVEKVCRREDLYHGPFLERAPDLIVVWKDYAYYSRQRFGEREKTVFQTHLTRPLSTIEMNAYHKLEGIFVISGEEIAAGKEIHGAKIIDVAPTILSLMGLPVPQDMDGTVLTEVFTQSFLDAHPISYDGPEGGGLMNEAGKVLTEEEENLVKERLRGLGYL